MSNPSLTVGPDEPAVFNGTLTASGGYASPVTLTCAAVACHLPAFLLPRRSLPTAAGAAFTVTTSSDVQKTYDFNIVATGTDVGHTTHSQAVELIVGFNFALNNNSTGQTIASGQTASFNLDADPLGNGSTFPSAVTLSCAAAGLPPLSTCSFTPKLVAAGSGDTNVLLNIVTTAATTATARLSGTPYRPLYGVGFLMLGLALGFSGLRRPARRSRKPAAFLVLALLLSGFMACGGGGGGGGGSGAGHPGTPAGNYNITVSGVVGSTTRTVQVVLTVQ